MILVGAIAAGMVLFTAGIIFIIFFTIPFASLFIRLGKKKFLKEGHEKSTTNELAIYAVGVFLGLLSAAVLLIVVGYLLLLFFSDFSFD